MRWDEPHALIGRYFHEAANGVDQLVGSVCVFRYLEAGRVFIGERRNRNAVLRIVFC